MLRKKQLQQLQRLLLFLRQRCQQPRCQRLLRIVAFDDRTDMRALALHLFTFGDQTRVDHLGVIRSTKRTMHGRKLPKK